MPKYTILIETKEEESIALLMDAVNDCSNVIEPRNLLSTDYLLLDLERSMDEYEGCKVSFVRTE